MITGGIAANTGFGPRDILAMTPGDLRFWNGVLHAYFEATKPEE